MTTFAQRWSVSICRTEDGLWSLALMHSDDTTGYEDLSYELYSCSATLSQELATALDASISAFLVIAE